MKTRGKILIGIGIAGFCSLFYLRAYDAFLAFGGSDAVARVVLYTQMPAGLVREGDWAMDYEFDFDGRTIAGHTLFVPKKRPEPSKTIRVRFFSFAPSVSKPLSNISTTGIGGFVLVFVAIFRGVGFLRASNAGAVRTD